MHVELTKDKRDSILGRESFKGTFVCCDSPVCHYCANHHTPNEDSVDACVNCIHSYKGAYCKQGAGFFEDNFIGIECITWEED